jgi:hypothetical protein
MAGCCVCLVCRVGQNGIPIYTVHDRIFGDFHAKNTMYTPYIPIVYMTIYLMTFMPKIPYLHRIWFWPTLLTCN